MGKEGSGVEDGAGTGRQGPAARQRGDGGVLHPGSGEVADGDGIGGRTARGLTGDDGAQFGKLPVGGDRAGGNRVVQFAKPAGLRQAVGDISQIAPEQLVGALAGKRNRHLLPAHAREEPHRQRARVGASVAAFGADATVITAPASIAWLFNIRGGDVIRSPLPLSQAILKADGTARLFIEPAKVTEDLPAWLGNQVSLETPDKLAEALGDLSGKSVVVDPTQSSAWYFDMLAAAGAKVVRAMDPCTLPRACKNDIELDGTREAHKRDGAALTRFLHWLATEGQINPPDEKEAVAKLEGFREATGVLKDLSFDTIGAANGHGALPHYRPTERSNERAAMGSLLLVDSGGQYPDGTTDVTRTVAIGEPSPEMVNRNTLVLKGHLAIARLRFPAGTTGSAIDALARMALWAHGLDYDHGTGHGVGVYLGVHEGPQRISKAPNVIALQPGMIVSNEPGYYKDGEYGIRIENLEVVMPAEDIVGGDRPMHRFEALTLAPIDRRLVDKALLTAEEVAQFDAYHARVLREIGPRVEPEIRAWMEEVCAPL